MSPADDGRTSSSPMDVDGAAVGHRVARQLPRIPSTTEAPLHSTPVLPTTRQTTDVSYHRHHGTIRIRYANGISTS